VWFERPTDPSQWHWFATHSHGVNRGRGLVTGDVIRHDGLQVATIAQEVLVRRRRDV
jgi:acyl-CoA thioesterase